MKYLEILKFLNENNIAVMQPVIASEVSSQLAVQVSDEKFDEICEEAYNKYLDNCDNPDLDIWYVVDEVLCKHNLKE